MKNKANNQIVLIGFYGRSGSFFLHSLLDGHPELISMPPIYSSFVVDVAINNFDLSTAEKAYEAFTGHYGKLVDEIDYSDRDALGNYVRGTNVALDFEFSNDDVKAAFFEAFHYLENSFDEPKLRLFLAMHYAFDMVLNGITDFDVLSRKTILFQNHNPVYGSVNWFADRFAHVWYLQAIREPLVGLRSMLRAKIEQGNGQITTNYLASMMAQSFFGATRFKRKNVTHRAVKLEDLHILQADILKPVSEVLNIAWNECLLDTTFGKKAWGNIENRAHIKGFMPESQIIDISDMFPAKDAELFNSLMKPRLQYWNYSCKGQLHDDATSQLKKHIPLVEYLPFCHSKDELQAAYDAQIPIVRNDTLQLYYTYLQYFNDPLAEVVK